MFATKRSPPSADDRGNRRAQDRHVEQQRPVLDVEHVEATVRLERRVVSTLDLPEARDARAHVVASSEARIERSGDLSVIRKREK